MDTARANHSSGLRSTNQSKLVILVRNVVCVETVACERVRSVHSDLTLFRSTDRPPGLSSVRVRLRHGQRKPQPSFTCQVSTFTTASASNVPDGPLTQKQTRYWQQCGGSLSTGWRTHSAPHIHFVAELLLRHKSTLRSWQGYCITDEVILSFSGQTNNVGT